MNKLAVVALLAMMVAMATSLGYYSYMMPYYGFGKMPMFTMGYPMYGYGKMYGGYGKMYGGLGYGGLQGFMPFGLGYGYGGKLFG